MSIGATRLKHWIGSRNRLGAISWMREWTGMTADDFRKLALALPETEERGHMDHPDFRVHGKIFATLGYPNDEWGMVKIAPDDQLALVAAEPDVFARPRGNGASTVRRAFGSSSPACPPSERRWCSRAI